MEISYRVQNVLFLLIVMGFCRIGVAQEDGGWRKKLRGTWTIDRPETQKLWKGTELEQFDDALMMAPVAIPSIEFSASEIGFATRAKKSTYSFNSFDAEKNEITLSLTDEGFEYTQSLTVLSENMLVLNTPISVFGPMRIVYRRKGESKAKDSVLLGKLFGDWKLDQDLTEKLWAASCNVEQLKNFQPVGRRALANATKIKITRYDLLFADQTFLPWELLQEEKQSAIFRNTRMNQPVEIQLLREGVIHITYPARGLCGVFRNVKAGNSDAGDNFPDSELRKALLARFSAQPVARNWPDQVPPIGISGNVSIDEIEVRRKRAAEAVVGADITNMTIGLFASNDSNHFGIQSKYHFRFNRLDDIVDDTGKKLLTATRRAKIVSLNRFVQGRKTRGAGTRGAGPVIDFALEAPELGAKSIERIAGELQIAESTSKFVRFDDLAKIAGKSLKHPLMGEDAFVFDYSNAQQFHEASLQLKGSTKEHFVNWYLTDRNGTRINSSSSGRDRQQRTLGFHKKIPDNGRLVIVVADFDDVRTLPFEFKNIELAK